MHACHGRPPQRVSHRRFLGDPCASLPRQSSHPIRRRTAISKESWASRARAALGRRLRAGTIRACNGRRGDHGVS